MTDDFGEKEAFFRKSHQVLCTRPNPRQEISIFARGREDGDANGCLSKRRDVWIFAQKVAEQQRVQSTDSETYAGMEIGNFSSEIADLHTCIRFVEGGEHPPLLSTFFPTWRLFERRPFASLFAMFFRNVISPGADSSEVQCTRCQHGPTIFEQNPPPHLACKRAGLCCKGAEERITLHRLPGAVQLARWTTAN